MPAKALQLLDAMAWRERRHRVLVSRCEEIICHIVCHMLIASVVCCVISQPVIPNCYHSASPGAVGGIVPKRQSSNHCRLPSCTRRLSSDYPLTTGWWRGQERMTPALIVTNSISTVWSSVLRNIHQPPSRDFPPAFCC